MPSHRHVRQIAAPPGTARACGLASVAALSLVATLFWSGWAPSDASAITVAIDPGHGGRYSNANANGLKEKNVNLWVARSLEAQLEAKGMTVKMTRTTDKALELHDRGTWNWSRRARRYQYGKDGHRGGNPPYDDLQARCDIANRSGADVFVCIHCNGVSSSAARGFEDYSSNGDPLGRELAGYVKRSVIASTGLHDRGSLHAEFYVLRWTNMPAVLVENAFITNPGDAARLRSSTFRRRLASGIGNGISAWLRTHPFDRIWTRRTGASTAAAAAAMSRADYPSGATAAVIVRADAWRDAATAPTLASDLRAPLLFSSGSKVPSETAEELGRLGVTRVIVVGPEASEDATLAASLAEAAEVATTSVEVLGGTSRRSAAARVADLVGVSTGGEVVLANQDVPEAVHQATAYAARKHAPVLLTRSSVLGTSSAEFVAANRGRIRKTTVFGSTGNLRSSVCAGLPNVKRYYSRDRAWWAATPALSAFPTSANKRPVVVSAKAPTARMIAETHAAKVNQPIVLTEDAALPLYSRAFITYRASTITSFEIVDIGGKVPTTMDWVLRKCDYPWKPWSRE